jgi:N-sulfoglucosamine sulfohydrolase
MKPNILYFVCHDLGRALGCYGAKIPTPHLDDFSASGLRFTNAHCASPACSPSRACAMSGLYAHTSGSIGLSHMGWPLPMELQTSVDDFNAAGYQTILSGINHERHPRTDRYEVDLSRDWEDWKLPRAVDNALQALQSRDAERPFYLNIATQEPHACTWGDVGGRIPAMPGSWPSWIPDGMPGTPALEVAFRRFAAGVVLLDREFGRLMQGLNRLGLDKETLVVFTTDHGMSGPRGKGSLYGLGTEIALLMRWPEILEPGGLRGDPVSNISFRPTFAEAAQIAVVSTCQGTSFWNYARSAQNENVPSIFLERNFHGEMPWRTEKEYVDCYDPIRAVRTTTHLYIRNFIPAAKPVEPTPGVALSGPQNWQRWHESWELPAAPRPAEELYELAGDPLELCNIAGNPGASVELASLRGRLEKWIRESGDFIPGQPPARTEEPGWGKNWPARDV